MFHVFSVSISTLGAGPVPKPFLNCAAPHLDVIFDKARCLDACLHVETDVHLHIRFLVGQLDDWHLDEEGGGKRRGRKKKKGRKMSRILNNGTCSTRSDIRTGNQSVTSH